MFRQMILAVALILMPAFGDARPPDIDATGVQRKLNEILKAHATYKQLDATLVKRALLNYLELLDPSKTYFLETDVKPWTDPDDALVQQILEDYRKADYRTFAQINEVMRAAILRRRALDKEVANMTLPTKVDPKQFKDMPWAADQQQLLERILKIRGLQKAAIDKLEPDVRVNSVQRIAKRQAYVEDEILTNDICKRDQNLYGNVLKATAAALDAHTNYFTPDEASQFMISVQQRLFGIGAQLRDDINGLTVTKIVDGGPAALAGTLKVKDKIIAVNGESVVGMDIGDAVQLIRGPQNTPVTLTILRDEKKDGDSADGGSLQQKLDVTLKRGEVVLTEARYESSHEPFGDGAIAYLRLHSFYQDPRHSSASDLTNELNQLQKEHKIKGVILDLRSNTGGLLAQAVSVAGLFMTKGVVVSIKDETGNVQHLRDLDGKAIFNGPLVVLIDRLSASASEIVAQALQDYGRAVIVGDDHSNGKGSFQTFTLSGSGGNSRINPTGEYKVTRGRYYTVSGRTPQMVGVQSDIVVPGALSESEIGERYLKHPLENDKIDPNYDDQMLDIAPLQREALKALYRYDLQPQLTVYTNHLNRLRENSQTRISKNGGYQEYLKEVKKKSHESEEDLSEQNAKYDPQLAEAYNVIKDLIVLVQEK